MPHNNQQLLALLQTLNLGSGVAEVDDVLINARVETSTFTDLLCDRVDLIPGAKGSGKSALFSLFVKYLRPILFVQKKLVLAHGVQQEGDPVFNLYSDQFSKLTENQFISFWHLYFISLVNEELLKSNQHVQLLAGSNDEIRRFKTACAAARIPEIQAPQTLKGIIGWALNAARAITPTIKVGNPDIQATFDWPKPKAESKTPEGDPEPIYTKEIQNALNALLGKSGLTIWLMLDKLDEIFPRWSEIEKAGLRSLLKATYAFRSEHARIKLFIRDDIFEHLTDDPSGFPGLTHIVSRKADNLTWPQDDILHLIVKRVFSSESARSIFGVDNERLNANHDYRKECFYKAFPLQVHAGKKQTNTLPWIYGRCRDGRGVVAPRDVINFLNATRAAEIHRLQSAQEGQSEYLFSSPSIIAGFRKMSSEKKDSFLSAEFPQFRDAILKFQDGPAIYSESSIRKLLGGEGDRLIKALTKIGFISLRSSKEPISYEIPFLYRPAFEIRQRSAEE